MTPQEAALNAVDNAERIARFARLLAHADSDTVLDQADAFMDAVESGKTPEKPVQGDDAKWLGSIALPPKARNPLYLRYGVRVAARLVEDQAIQMDLDYPEDFTLDFWSTVVKAAEGIAEFVDYLAYRCDDAAKAKIARIVEG